MLWKQKYLETSEIRKIKPKRNFQNTKTTLKKGILKREVSKHKRKKRKRSKREF
jgi:hypothetical protein